MIKLLAAAAQGVTELNCHADMLEGRFARTKARMNAEDGSTRGAEARRVWGVPNRDNSYFRKGIKLTNISRHLASQAAHDLRQ